MMNDINRRIIAWLLQFFFLKRSNIKSRLCGHLAKLIIRRDFFYHYYNRYLIV